MGEKKSKEEKKNNFLYRVGDFGPDCKTSYKSSNTYLHTVFQNDFR